LVTDRSLNLSPNRLSAAGWTRRRDAV